MSDLRQKAGNPSYQALELRGRKQQPPVKLGKGKLSQWFNGKSVPDNDRPFTVLIELLENLAANKSGTLRRGRHVWLALREAADRERRAADTGTAPAPAGTTAAAAPNEGGEPASSAADAGKARRLVGLLPPDGAWHRWLRKAETMFRVPLSVSHPVCDAEEALQDDPLDYVDLALRRAHEEMLAGLAALCFELNGMTDISDEGPQVLEINHPGTAAERNELNRQACTARDRFLAGYKEMVNLLNARGMLSPVEPSPAAAP
ncbi:hypothetical protein PV341_29460 [Streptomyces sp. PA03-1a]|nr:hypothetical protein [Streptomyces sp. PA03-1a]